MYGSLAQAAGGSPFGLGRGLGGLFGQHSRSSGGYGGGQPVITPPPRYGQNPVPTTTSRLAGYRAFQQGSSVNTAPTAAQNNVYNVATDPAYQQAQALLGLSDQQAKASAQKQIKDLLLAYGDPGLIEKVLGDGGSDLAKAAKANPTSTLAQLGQQKTRNLTQLDNQLNSANLSYSGYRVDQEKQAAQDYQNALATAAANVNGQIGSIQSALQQALFSNQWQLAQSAQQAAQNASGAGFDPSLYYSGSAAPGGSSVVDWARYLMGGK